MAPGSGAIPSRSVRPPPGSQQPSLTIPRVLAMAGAHAPRPPPPRVRPSSAYLSSTTQQQRYDLSHGRSFILAALALSLGIAGCNEQTTSPVATPAEVDGAAAEPA